MKISCDGMYNRLAMMKSTAGMSDNLRFIFMTGWVDGWMDGGGMICVIRTMLMMITMEMDGWEG